MIRSAPGSLGRGPVVGIGSIIGMIVSVLVGGTVAAVTLFGLINGQVNGHADRVGDVSSPTIDYGSTE